MTLGTRITIMKQGYIQQVDHPITVYDHPSNMFVAGFVGSPAMNFINGMIRKEDGKFVFVTDAFKVWLPDNLYDEFEKLQDKDWILGIRPEDVLDKQTAMYLKKDFNFLEAEVEFSEVLGSENFIHMRLGEVRFVSKVDAHIIPKIGEKMSVAMDLRKMHLFDRTTTKKII